MSPEYSRQDIPEHTRARADEIFAAFLQNGSGRFGLRPIIATHA
ncbi:MAG: hypothetical protein OJF49_002316 [Ktedonobacterales bacterium]|nr:MAG: hypothetical protein OJF49_002316 [Ktedonobacterales bacterium]